MTSVSPVLFGLPAPDLFVFPPSLRPATVPPPPPSSATLPAPPPFEISDSLFAAALDPRVPLTIAALYAVTVKLLSRYNASHGKQPWRISKTKAFFAFVVAHNVFLATYSAWTWWGMLGALRRTLVSPLSPDGVAGFVDSACRLNGPAGLGRGAFFDDQADIWMSYAGTGGVSPWSGGEPSTADTGRMWNEGLAFYGWLFYISKFYEVLDTFIILAKGKQSSTLQTYHHAGAMMCMWAGIRYMAAPIWVFVFFNSFIHAIMYTYYTITAFNIRVPTAIKRTLTSMQITQFVVGASLAMVHSFVSYTIPVIISMASPDAATTASAVASSSSAATSSLLAEPTPAAILDGLKNVVFGVASRAAAPIAAAASSSSSSSSSSTPLSSPAIERLQEEAAAAGVTLTYGQRVVPCVSSGGETFAIWLNVSYLAPLTYLFVSFFITSYLRRSSAESRRVRASAKADPDGLSSGPSRRMSNVVLAEKAGWDAARGVEREVYGQEGENGEQRGGGGRARGQHSKKSNGAAARR